MRTTLIHPFLRSVKRSLTPFKHVDQREIVIESGRTERNYWGDLWRFRELFYILSWRDILVRYKQTVLGVIWALLKPVMTIIIFTLLFGRIAKLASFGTPYAILVLTGMLPWNFFSTAISEASGSLVNNVNLVTRVYFPRIIIPASSIITSFVDFAISFVLLIILMAVYRVVPSWHVMFLPLFIVLAFLCSFGVGLFLTAVTVKFRDFRHIVPFIVQFGLYVSPVGFTSEIIPPAWKLFYYINPMAGVIDGFRFCLLKNAPLYYPGFIFSAIMSALFMYFGLLYFRKTEKSFADDI